MGCYDSAPREGCYQGFGFRLRSHPANLQVWFPPFPSEGTGARHTCPAQARQGLSAPRCASQTSFHPPTHPQVVLTCPRVSCERQGSLQQWPIGMAPAGVRRVLCHSVPSRLAGWQRDAPGTVRLGLHAARVGGASSPPPSMACISGRLKCREPIVIGGYDQPQLSRGAVADKRTEATRRYGCNLSSNGQRVGRERATPALSRGSAVESREGFA